MTKQEIENIRRRVSAFVDQRRLRDALSEIKEQAHKRMIWEVEDKAKTIEQNYAYMLSYLTQGASDPDRNDVYNSIVVDIYGLIDSLVSYLRLNDSPTLYFSNLRYYRMHPSSASIADLIHQYEEKADKLSLFSLVMSNDNSDEHKNRIECERLQSDIFVRIWTTPQLSSDDKAGIMAMLEGNNVKPEMKQQVVSALTLGLLQQYDERKLSLLMSTYMSAPNIKVSSAALMGMLLGLWKYAKRPLTRKLNEQLMAVKDKESWSSDLRIAFIELIRTRDTERINRKVRDEIIPRMEKIRPDMIDKINNINIDPDDPMSLQENPEWQDMLEKSGVADQLKELTEIQMEGGDVMMSTFSHLKNFTFFQNIANWFLPFDSSHSSVSETVKSLDIIGDMMENARFLCDSDKYSFMFAIHTVPAAQRDLMISQMKSQSEGIYEAMSSLNTGQGPENRKLAISSYMQNIYRFFKLFYRKDEFFDPFDRSLNLISVPSLSDDFDDIEMLKVVAEFYFKLKYLQEALDVYMRIEQLSASDASRCQKIGYCYERLGKYAQAIDYYQRAELLDTESAWTIKRLASAYRTIGDKNRALSYYKRLATIRPDDINAAMLYGQSLLENGDYQEALHEFYRAEFMDETSSKVWRPLAWTLFMNHDFESAKTYYDRIVADNPTANDYLNIGHINLAKGDIKAAVDSYSKSIAMHDNDKEWFIQALNEDVPSLIHVGIDKTTLPLIADATLYRQ